MIARLGVQPRPLRALLGALLKMDLRNQAYGAATGAKAAEAIPPGYWVLGQFLTTSALLSVALFARVDAWFFAFANLSTFAAMLLSALVVEFHEVVLDPADVNVLGHRPLSRNTYAAARLLNLGGWVAMISLAMAIFPAVLGVALRDGGWAFLPAYLAATAVVALGVTASVVLLFTLFSAGKLFDKVRGLLSWLQVAMILALFYGAQLMLRRSDGSLEYFAARPPQWVLALPTSELARVVAAAGQGAVSFTWLQAALVVVAALLLPALAALRLGAAWEAVHSGSLKPSGARFSAERSVTSFRWLARERHVWAGFWLTRTLLSRDDELRLRSWPALATPFAALALGAFTGQLGNPSLGRGTDIVLPLAVGVLLAAAVPSVFQNALFTRDTQGSWQFHLAPMLRGAELARGVRRALLLTFFAPATLLVTAVLGWVWRDALGALLFFATAWLLIEHAARLAQVMVWTRLPFSVSLTRGATLGAIALVSAVASAGAMGVGASQYALAGNLLGQAAIPVVLAALLIPSSRWADAAAERVAKGRHDG